MTRRNRDDGRDHMAEQPPKAASPVSADDVEEAVGLAVAAPQRRLPGRGRLVGWRWQAEPRLA